jgi:hypothetical protein
MHRGGGSGGIAGAARVGAGGQRQLQRVAHQQHGDQVGVHVARRPPVLIPAAGVVCQSVLPPLTCWPSKLTSACTRCRAGRQGRAHQPRFCSSTEWGMRMDARRSSMPTVNSSSEPEGCAPPPPQPPPPQRLALPTPWATICFMCAYMAGMHARSACQRRKACRTKCCKVACRAG